MNISVVIPCYNEEQYLPACLTALTKQTVPPLEIIVVDNNSTDASATIARSFGARVVRETAQGMTPARNRGFDEARGDIIARCDADSRTPPEWLARITEDFEKYRPDALTGPISFYDYGSSTTFYTRLYQALMRRLLKGNPTLEGPNMIVRKKAWNEVRPEVCFNDKDVHEDIDLTIHLLSRGKKILFDPQLTVAISGRRLKHNPLSFFVEYPTRLFKTIRTHGKLMKNASSGF